MADKIEKVPEQRSWEIATKSLTGAYIAISNARAQVVGKDKFDAFNGPPWYEAGKEAREFADSLGLKHESAEDVEAITHLLAKTSMGPRIRVRSRRSDPRPLCGKDDAVPLVQAVEGTRRRNRYLQRGTSKLR